MTRLISEFSSSGQIQHRDRIRLTFFLKQTRGRRLGMLLQRERLGSAEPFDNSNTTPVQTLQE
jgi:hypothetical protein